MNMKSDLQRWMERVEAARKAYKEAEEDTPVFDGDDFRFTIDLPANSTMPWLIVGVKDTSRDVLKVVTFPFHLLPENQGPKSLNAGLIWLAGLLAPKSDEQHACEQETEVDNE